MKTTGSCSENGQIPHFINRELTLYGKDISVLKDKAEAYEALLREELGRDALRGIQRENPCLGEVNYFIEQLCGGRYRGLIFRDLSGFREENEPSVEGIVYTIPCKGCQYYFVILSKEYEDLACGRLVSKTRADEEKIRDAYCHLKLVYLHEICHLVLQEKGMSQASLPLIPLEDVGEAANGTSKTGLLFHLATELARQYASFEESECYLLTYVLAFWPLSDFIHRVKESFTPSKWQLFDIRASLAGYYHMPIKDTAVWLVILFGELFNAHYVCRRESDKRILDTYAHDKNVKAADLEGFFDEKQKIAHQVASTRSDKKTPSLDGHDGYVCIGAFEPGNAILNRAAETIVVGFSAEKVREARGRG